jgi:hypothetical protein
MTRPPSALDAFLETVSDEDRAEFLESFTFSNPHWDGAHVGDILEHLSDTDANLAKVEPFCEAHDHPHADHAARMALWINGGDDGWEQTALRLLGMA